MADSVRVAFPTSTAVSELPSIRVSAVPWYVWSAALAVTSTTVGLYWDISWHIGIGRDTFWTPAHVAIQFGAVLTGLSCAYLILRTTFAGDAESQEKSVKIWGLRGPLGAFIAAWGGFCMLVSAPFDNWWHESYGLDVTILSPPHVVLLVGIFVMGLGGLILTTGQMNLSFGDSRGKSSRLLLYSGSLLLGLLLMLGYEYIGDQTLMHSAIYYRVLGMIAPVVLVGIARSSGSRWAATTVASIYTGLWLAGNWILPLFPAHAKLGPVFTPITHMVPLGFPVLLVPGALALDLVLDRFSGRGDTAKAALGGIAFMVATLAVNWPFAYFMMSPYARNWVFTMNEFGYNVPPSQYHLAWELQSYEKTRVEFWIGMLIALAATLLSARIGMLWGDWMRRIRR
ncbi:MAG: hypothetical protein WB762_21805 [Candidatus Sulfotelmatobacter sp.]